MAENVKLAENVILVDVAYFNDVVKDLKRYFELQLGRPLQNIYVEEWASYLALDSGVRDKDFLYMTVRPISCFTAIRLI